jgi:hypothetical protein
LRVSLRRLTATRAIAVASIALLLSARSPRAERRLQTLAPNPPAAEAVCGTSVDADVRGMHADAVTPSASGDVLSFDQDPPLITPNHSGPIVLRHFEVVGDVPTLEFHRADLTAPRIEIWQRITTRGAGGHLISVFEPSWGDTELDSVIAQNVFGYEGPGLYWGSIVQPGHTPLSVFLRMGLAGIPSSQVVRINDRVQYASNVVNLVAPGFGDGRAAGGSKAFELMQVANQFYQYFDDRYDVMAIVPQSSIVADYSAFHHNVQNRVAGLNLPLLDDSSSYGSAGVLQGIEVYAATTAANYGDTNHEMAHQWGSAFDWSSIAGIVRAGHEPSLHAPLWTGGETLLGAVLAGTRRVGASADGYVIQRTPSPVRFHPLDLYAMGVLPESQVPDFGVFTDQAQFDVMTPPVGTRLSGAIRRISIADVVRRHGQRQGPAPSHWRRATVVVSRDHLISQREMDYWNFFAQRLADRDGRGLAATDSEVPFHVATNNAVTLSTAIAPLERPALAQTLDTDAPVFGAADWRGVEFTTPVRGRIRADRLVELAGRVTAAGAVDFDHVAITFWRDGEEPFVFSGDISRSGDFTVPVRFPTGTRGRFVMSVYLFWQDSGPQYPRTSLTSVLVE